MIDLYFWPTSNNKKVTIMLHEVGLPYRLHLVNFIEGENYRDDFLALNPNAKTPTIVDDEGPGGKPITIFESGAILLHLGARSGALMPTDPCGRSEAVQWLFAALNSVEMASMPWSLLAFTGEPKDAPASKFFEGFLKQHRLAHLEPVLADREWLAGSFSVADVVMADALRFVDRFDGLADYPACRAYVARATARPAFIKAHADQIAHFAAAD